MADRRGGLEVLTETFRADVLTKDLVERVQKRGVDIAYQWLKGKADLGDTDVVIEVDGKADRILENWRRRIRLAWGSGDQLRQVVDFINTKIVQATPRDTGALASAWQWSLNGSPIAMGSIRTVADSFKAGDQLLLYNLKPCLRRANQIYKKPRGIVGPVARAAKNKFRGFYIAEKWVEIPGHVFAKGIRPTSGRKSGFTKVRGADGKYRVDAKSAADRTDQRIPCIVIMKARKARDVTGV